MNVPTQSAQPGTVAPPQAETMPTTPEQWQALLKSRMDALEAAKDHYVRCKATVDALDKELGAVSAETLATDESAKAEYEAKQKQLTGERQSMAFAQANRAIARGNLEMCKAHMAQLGLKAKRTRTASVPTPMPEDTPEVKAKKAEIANLEAEATEIRNRRDKITADHKSAIAAYKAALKGNDEELGKTNAAKVKLMSELAAIDPVTKEREARKAEAKAKRESGEAGTPGRKSKFAGKVITAKSLDENPYKLGTIANAAYDHLVGEKGRAMTYEALSAKGVVSKTITAIIKDGNATAKDAPTG